MDETRDQKAAASAPSREPSADADDSAALPPGYRPYAGGSPFGDPDAESRNKLEEEVSTEVQQTDQFMDSAPGTYAGNPIIPGPGTQDVEQHYDSMERSSPADDEIAGDNPDQLDALQDESQDATQMRERAERERGW